MSKVHLEVSFLKIACDDVITWDDVIVTSPNYAQVIRPCPLSMCAKFKVITFQGACFLNFITKRGKKLLQNGAAQNYYKTGRKFITKRGSLIYYKTGQVYYKTRQVLQNGAIITKRSSTAPVLLISCFRDMK